MHTRRLERRAMLHRVVHLLYAGAFALRRTCIVGRKYLSLDVWRLGTERSNTGATSVWSGSAVGLNASLLAS